MHTMGLHHHIQILIVVSGHLTVVLGGIFIIHTLCMCTQSEYITVTNSSQDCVSTDKNEKQSIQLKAIN